MRRNSLFSVVLCLGIFWGYAPATAKEPTPIEDIPKLMMFDRFADYLGIISVGTLAPDRIKINGSTARVNQKEPALIKVLGSDYSVVEKEEHRTRNEQWSYLRGLCRQHDNSMHYYIVSDIYYDQQLSGLFKVLQWTLGDLNIKAFLVRPDDEKVFHVYLLHIKPELDLDRPIHRTGLENQIFIREGDRELRWNIRNNSVAINAEGETFPRN